MNEILKRNLPWQKE